jgi:ribosomal subunit interface protein
MHCNLKGTDVALTPEIHAYVEKRLQALDKFVEHAGAERADVELQFLRGEAHMYRAEFTYREPGLGEPLRAERRGATLHEAVDLAVAELFREMTQSKKKRITVVRRAALRAKEFMRGLRNRF